MLDNMKNGNFSSVPMPSSSSNPSDTATHIPTMPHTTKFGDWSFLQHSLLLSNGFIHTAETVYKSQTDNRTRLLIKKIMNLLKDANKRRLTAEEFDTRFNEIEAEWIKIVDGTSFAGRANVGDRVTLETKLLILLHWATPACMKKEGPNKVDTKQGVIITMKRSFPSSLNNEAGEGYLSKEDLDALDEKITIHDFHPVVPKTKDDHDGELDEVADEIGVTREEYEVLCALLFLCKVTYSSLLNDGKRCRMVCGSSIVYSKMFVTSTDYLGPTQTDWMLDCGELSHPETYCAGYIGNILVFPLLRLDAQCRTLVLAYSSVCHTPVVSRIAYRFGGIDGKSPEELELLAEAMHDICVKGGEMSASMLIEAKNFVHMCMANDEMSREDAIELLRETCPKHASHYEYEGCIKGGESSGVMATDAAEFVHELASSGMDREDAIELPRSSHPKHASRYEGCIKGGETSGVMVTDSKEFVHERVESGMEREDAIELLKTTHPKHASRYEGCIKGAKMGHIKNGKKWYECIKPPSFFNNGGQMMYPRPAVLST